MEYIHMYIHASLWSCERYGKGICIALFALNVLNVVKLCELFYIRKDIRTFRVIFKIFLKITVRSHTILQSFKQFEALHISMQTVLLNKRNIKYQQSGKKAWIRSCKTSTCRRTFYTTSFPVRFCRILWNEIHLSVYY